MIGIRAICFYSEEVYEIRRGLKKYIRETDITDKSNQLEETEDKFGYKSLHLLLVLRTRQGEMVDAEKFKNIRIELQIRTVIQDAWSILDHKIKYKNSIPQNLKRRINRLSALFEIADEEFLNIQKEKKQSLNPYTKIRYRLYRSNEKSFNAILSLHQQGIFTSQT